VDGVIVMEMNVLGPAQLSNCKLLKNNPVSDVKVSLHEFTLCQG